MAIVSISWTLQYGATEKTFTEWGLSQLRFEQLNLEPDRVSFVQDGAKVDSTPLFPYDALIIIKRDGVQWFTGRRQKPVLAAEISSESLSYEFLGPVNDLVEIVFQQTWKVTNGITTTLIDTTKSRVILNQDLTGARTNTGQQITAALEYAISLGANLQIGTIGVSAVVPYSEAKDQSTLDIIRNMLRWTPDAVGWVDYSTTPPTFNVTRRGDAEAVSLPLFPTTPAAPEVFNAGALQLIPRDDLKVPVVVLKFSRANTINDQSWTSVEIQKYPTGATEAQRRAYIGNIDLDGFRETYLQQYVQVETINEGSADWWQSLIPWLRSDSGVTVTDVAVESSELELSEEAIADGKELADFPSYITKGSCPAWKDGTTYLLTARAKLTVTTTDSDNKKHVSTNVPVTINIQGTSLGTNTYTELESFTAAEATPTGLAQQIYEALSVLQYEGTIRVTERECSSAIRVGQNLNLTGGRSEWATFAAQIQKVTEDVDNGTTEITIGPAKHLGGDDLKEMMRATRNWRPAEYRNQRLSGASEGRASVTGSLAQNNEGHSAAPYIPDLVLPVGDYTLTVQLKDIGAAGSIPGDLTVKLRPVSVCESGTTKTILVLASESF